MNVPKFVGPLCPSTISPLRNFRIKISQCLVDERIIEEAISKIDEGMKIANEAVALYLDKCEHHFKQTGERPDWDMPTLGFVPASGAGGDWGEWVWFYGDERIAGDCDRWLNAKCLKSLLIDAWEVSQGVDK